MKKFNIAVIVDKHHAEYTIEIIKGIHDFYKDKDVNLIISEVSTPHFKGSYYEYQKWSNTKILASECIDSAIFISGSFCNYMTSEQLAECLKDYKSKKTISIGIELKLKNCSYTKIDCENIYLELIKHLKETHNCKRIAFMSANLTKSIESLEREKAFKNALKLNNLKFYEEDQIDANFTTKIAEEVLEKKYKSKEDVKFDAIVAANDLMAIGCINFFHTLGFNIPEDIKVVGFDDAYIAKMSIPPLTTINQEIYMQGYKVAELAYKSIQNIKIPLKTDIPLTIKYRNSCGCINCKEENSNPEQLQIDYFDIASQLSKTNNILDIVQNIKTFDDIYITLPTLIDLGYFSGIGIILYENPIINRMDDNFKLPNKAYQVIFIDKKNNISLFDKNKTYEFNPNKEIIPNQIADINPDNYILQSIYYGEENYGYMILRIKKLSFHFYSVILKVYANMIAQAYEFSKKLSENSLLSEKNSKLAYNNTTLTKISRLDELTKLYNRRGFIEKGQEVILQSISGSKPTGLIIFADLDRLKLINDTYGHKMGDKAIKTMAQVLKKSFRSSDIIARLSGDEFALISPGLNKITFEEIRKKINKNFQNCSIENKLPFVVSASFGSVEYNSSFSNLKELLEKADKDLYIEKNSKHSNKFTISTLE